jgi:AsmA-like C-terminal region
MAFDGPMVDAYLVPVVDVMQLDGVVSCLSDEKSLYSGNFNLDGHLSARARREDIVRALNGRLTLVAEDGTIQKSLFFARLFSLLNLTEIYRGKLPDFSSQGLDYKRSTALIEVKEGKILISDWSIEGLTLWIGSRGEIDIASQEIDFTIMVSPFKTIDRIINSIPGLRWILGGRLVAIPMKATGNMEDPQITALSPSAVGTSILEMIDSQRHDHPLAARCPEA